MDYSMHNKEELIKRIEELERLNAQLLIEKEKAATLDFPWTGNLGNWYWDFKSNIVTFNPLKIKALGYDEDEVPRQVNYQFFTDKLHKDDFKNTMEAMKRHLYGDSPVYEVEYRIQAKDGSYKWYYDRGAITTRDEDGKPVLLAGIVFDITQKKNMEEELERKNCELQKLSMTDSLTNLKNHRAILSFLKREMEESQRFGEDLSIIMLDIDDFKVINDSKGHLAGDKVLSDIGKIARKSLRKTDAIGRYGGEEFLLVLPFTKGSDALIIGDRIRKRIEDHIFIEGLKLTISGDIKEYFGESIKEFINEADKKLYEAKRTGKNKIVY